MSERPHFPADLRDCDVTAVEVTAPFRVRVVHRDGTSAVHIFRPGDFGTSDFSALDSPDVFATAAVIDDTLGWVMPSGLIYDLASDGLWAHAHGWCPDGTHDLAAEVEDARIDLVTAVFVRGEGHDAEARIAATPGLAQQLSAANSRPSEEFRPRDRGRPRA